MRLSFSPDEENGLSKYLSDVAATVCCACSGPVAWQWSLYISASTEPVSLGVPYRPLYTPAPPPPAVTPMTGSEVGGSLNRLGGAPDPPGEGEERQGGLAAWGVQVGCVNSLGVAE